MQNAVRWGRVGLSGIMVVLCAGACDSVLDIEEPRRRAEAGAAGDASGPAAGAPGGGTQGFVPGEGGAGATPPEGGVAGEPPAVAIGGGGDGGAPPMECEPNDVRCTGDAEKSPEICDKSGHWIHNDAEADADCPTLCDAGRCVECTGTNPRCSDCEDGDENCTERMPQTCVDGIWEDANQPCEHYCVDGSCGQPPSCEAELPSDCSGESCCLSLFIPGGDFKRDFDGASNPDASHPASISAFLMDKYEVTVGRFQPFVDAYGQLNLVDGDGKATHIAGDSGWNADNVRPPDEAALKTELASCGSGSTWAEGGGAAQKLPINCITFNVAYAFCIWDGGRLPTEAEWNFAASGGDDQRLYPWLHLAGPAIDDEHAVYNSLEPIPAAVGTKPKGNARWGHADMAGNVAEMVLDHSHDLSSEPCIDCVNLAADDAKVLRGGSFALGDDLLYVATRMEWDPTTATPDIGFRCVRDIN